MPRFYQTIAVSDLVPEQLKKNPVGEIIEAESRLVVGNSLTTDNLESLPMAVKHVLRVELNDKRTQLLHISDTLHKSSKCFEVLDLLVNG